MDRPIPGTTNAGRLGENVGAAQVNLSADDLQEIDAAVRGMTIRAISIPKRPSAGSIVERASAAGGAREV
ncbi:MAG: hypothetical protein U0132_21965 [Gemmatimonadaceae bacterium]